MTIYRKSLARPAEISIGANLQTENPQR